MKKLSVIIPVYNSKSYLKKLLDCFDKKYDTLYEIIIINDGSTDSSLEICESYKRENVKIYSQENKGVSSARNYGIKRATGKYLTFVDSDDLINFENYIKIITEIKNEDLIINDKRKIKNKELYFLIEKEIINSPSQKFYKRSLIKKYNILFDESIDLGEDLKFNINYYLSCSSIKFTNLLLYKYIKRENSLTTKYRNNKYNGLISLNNQLRYQLENYYKCDNALYYIKLKNIISCIKDFSSLNCNFSKNEKISFVKEMKKELKILIILNNFNATFLNLFIIFCPKQKLLELVSLYVEVKNGKN